MKPYYERDGCRIYLGDCREVVPSIGISVSTVITDPPYGLTQNKRGGSGVASVSNTPAGRSRISTGNGPGGFMGCKWDAGVPDRETWLAFHSSLLPGAMLLAFGGTRTWHRLACAIEEAGYEIRDTMMWLYGQGFPKSLDVSKEIDKGFRRDETGEGYQWQPSNGPAEDVYAVTAFIKAGRDKTGVKNKEIDALFGFNGMAGHWTSSTSQPAVPTWPQWIELKKLLRLDDSMDDLVERINGGKGDRSLEGTAFAEREVVGTAVGKDARAGDMYSPGSGSYIRIEHDVTAPETGAAKHWQGYGTALKPAWEPIVLAMKPTAGTFAQNALAHGVAGLNVDGARIGTDPRVNQPMGRPERCYGGYGATATATATAGRFPANLLLDEEAARMLDEQSGERGGGTAQIRPRAGSKGYGGGLDQDDAGLAVTYGDRGGASRFFYVAKASNSDRGHEQAGPLPLFGEPEYESRNTHPTVKPTELMRYLCRLTRTPTGGLVLDPFMGSGSTLVAARAEGRPCVGIEIEEQYAEIAATRLEKGR